MARKSSRQLWADQLSGKKVTLKKVAELQTNLRKTPFTGLVMGIDPSLRGTGISIIDFQSIDDATLLFSVTINNDKSLSSTQCLGRMVKVVTSLLEKYEIKHAACEETIYVQNFQTAQVLGAARGALLGAVASRDIPVFEYSPLRIKKSVVGIGRASKEQVAKTVRSLLHMSAILPFDEADAAAVALCHAYTNHRL